MSDTSYQQLQKQVGQANNATDYPWSYDPVFMRDYSEGMGYQPVYLRNFENKEESENCDKILNALYQPLKV